LKIADRDWSSGKAITARDVVASIRRATPPSGFAAIGSARARGPRTIELRGHSKNWGELLARGTFVMPSGRLLGGRLSGSDFRFSSYDRGRRLVYEPSPSAGEPPLLDELAVSFVQSTDVLLRLLDEGRVDAAWLPSTVNLGDRLEELGIEHSSILGEEKLVLRTNRVSNEVGESIVRSIDMRVLAATFLRREGKAAHFGSRKPGPLPAVTSIAVPEGDELLALIQRAMQLELKRDGVTTELITGPMSTFYGRWTTQAPADISLLRSFDRVRAGERMLASVFSFVAWRGKVHGIAVNPSLEGPLWNARVWWREPSI
jgi:hypothetical protein